MGHQEYDKGNACRRVQKRRGKGLDTAVPENYFRNDDPDDEIMFRWRSHASLLFSNWLNYYVYQNTPYDLSAIKGMSE